MPKPTAEMARTAKQALEWREEYGRGGTETGVARARDISNRADLSDETVARMRSFFARHGVNREEHYSKKEPDGGPTAWRIAWDLWGGDPGRSWANRIGKEEDSKAMSHMETKSIGLDLKKAPDDDGVIEGYANVYEIVDQVDDIVAHGAFAKSLQSGRKVRMLWQHYSDMPIGVWDEIREDEKGLYVKGRISKDVQQGREAMALFKMGAIDSLSIGFRTKVSEKEGSSGSIRRILEGDLFEISVVTMPANDKAVATVKSIRTIREFEKALRDAGFSQTEAKAIAADGFKGLADHRDDVEVEAEADDWKIVFDQLRQLQEKLTDV